MIRSHCQFPYSGSSAAFVCAVEKKMISSKKIIEKIYIRIDLLNAVSLGACFLCVVEKMMISAKKIVDRAN
jgi:hypothetical protein